MTDRTCPLGEDCDLTVAWMAGREEARDQFRARIEQLETQLGLARIDADQQRARAEALEAALQAADELARAVDGLGARKLVAGWNGEARETPYPPHPRRIKATLQTTCGVVYDIDAALAAYRARRATGGGT